MEQEGGEKSQERRPLKKAKREASSGAEEAILLVQSDDDQDDQDDVMKTVSQVVAKSKKPKPTLNGKKKCAKLSPEPKNGHLKRKSKDSPSPTTSKKTNGLEPKCDDHSTGVQASESSSAKAQRQVCCVCLNKQSDGSNELVECDSCGFMVHEGCYGITDTDSKLSTHSEASTEPWFCNSCLLDDARLLDDYRLNAFDQTPFLNRSCELCPNTRCGLMKETNSARFVHIVCALYTPGISYYDTDILWPVVLDEIAAQSWGAQVCSLCDNPQLARTGVCIKCDAGLCRTYFHVTCAQKHGYLCDPTLQNENDPFIAYCKIHNDKPVISSRKANHKLMLANLEEKWFNRSSRQFEYSEDKVRLSVKYQTARDNYQIKRQKHMRKPSTVKIPRMLTTCPSALKMLLAKTSLRGSSVADEIETNNLNRRNLGSHPTFTVEFLKYYLDREKKMPDYYKELHELKLKQQQLSREEETLRQRLDSLSADSSSSKTATNGPSTKSLDASRELLGLYVKFYETVFPQVKDFAKSPSKSVYSLLELTTTAETPASKKVSKLKSMTSNTPKSELRKQDQSDGDDSTPRSSRSVGRPPKSKSKSSKENSKPVTPETKVSPVEAINLNACCSACSKKTNSHLLIDCDSCKKYYHISCLNPPLSHMPKKTKLYGWECSFCAVKKDSDYEADSDEMDEILTKNSKSFNVFKRPKIDLEGQRQLRRERNKKVIFDS